LSLKALLKFMKIFKNLSLLSKYLVPTIPFICFFLGYAVSNLLVGNKTYKTPELIGLSLHQAIEKTSPYQITIQLVAEKESPGTRQGTIISQKPSAGRSIKSHQSILVVATKLPPAAKAPNLIGKSYIEIEKTEKSKHLKFKTCSLNYPAPKGTCIAQIPQPNQSVVDKKMILYTAQEKQNKYIMPALIDKEVIEVVQFLKSHSLAVAVFFQNQKITEPYSNDMTIIAQKPLAGSIINLQENATIQLEVCRK
jgi:beta-lactam-binding protein with PASTA domain